MCTISSSSCFVKLYVPGTISRVSVPRTENLLISRCLDAISALRRVFSLASVSGEVCENPGENEAWVFALAFASALACFFIFVGFSAGDGSGFEGVGEVGREAGSVPVSLVETDL